MWTALLKIFIGGLPAIVKEITAQKQIASDAKTETQRIEAEERIKVLEAKRDVILESQRGRLGEIVRLLWAIPFILYVWKLLVWDKILGWGVTDDLGPILEYILWTVLGGYFVLGVTDKFTRR